MMASLDILHGWLPLRNLIKKDNLYVIQHRDVFKAVLFKTDVVSEYLRQRILESSAVLFALQENISDKEIF